MPIFEIGGEEPVKPKDGRSSLPADIGLVSVKEIAEFRPRVDTTAANRRVAPSFRCSRWCPADARVARSTCYLSPGDNAPCDNDQGAAELHCGIVDDAYMRATGDPHATVGRKVSIQDSGRRIAVSAE